MKYLQSIRPSIIVIVILCFTLNLKAQLQTYRPNFISVGAGISYAPYTGLSQPGCQIKVDAAFFGNAFVGFGLQFNTSFYQPKKLEYVQNYLSKNMQYKNIQLVEGSLDLFRSSSFLANIYGSIIPVKFLQIAVHTGIGFQIVRSSVGSVVIHYTDSLSKSCAETKMIEENKFYPFAFTLGFRNTFLFGKQSRVGLYIYMDYNLYVHKKYKTHLHPQSVVNDMACGLGLQIGLGKR